MIRKIVKFEFARFIVIGSTTFIIDFTINNLIVLILDTNHTIESIIANIISVPIAFTYNFFMSYNWTFANTTNKRSKFLKFLSVGVFNYALSTFLIGFTVEVIISLETGLEEFIIQSFSKFAIMFLLTFWSYFVYKYWVFNEIKR